MVILGGWVFLMSEVTLYTNCWNILAVLNNSLRARTGPEEALADQAQDHAQEGRRRLSPSVRVIH